MVTAASAEEVVRKTRREVRWLVRWRCMLVWGAWGRGKESSRGLEAARDREDMFGRAEAMVRGGLGGVSVCCGFRIEVWC